MDTLLTTSGLSAQQIKLQKERATNPSVIRVEKSLRLLVSFTYVDSNFKEAVSAINFICNADKFVEFHTTQKRHIHLHLRDNINRLIFNYISSAFSLVDHSRQLYKKMFGPEKMPEYQTKIDELNANPVAKFIKDLRNYVIHYQPLDLDTTYIFSVAKDEISIIVGLGVDDLLKWDSWTSDSKKYIKLKGTFINIQDTLNEYQNVIAEFQHWFREEQKKALFEDWKVYEEYEKAISKEIALNCVKILQELSVRTKKFSMVTLESELASTISSSGFWKEIDEKDSDMKARFYNIFSALAQYGIEESSLLTYKEKIFTLITNF